MSIKIAVAGKGGTGKTTICSLIVRILIEQKNKTVLALDADPNSNLNELLGVKINGTIGQLVEEFKKNGGIISSGLFKDQIVQMDIHKIITEGKGFDLLVMGRGEGPGCYCAANNLFKKYIDLLQENYSYVVMDNEAGMEHLSRKTTNSVDYLLIITDPTPRGIMSAYRIKQLVEDLNIKTKKSYLIINRLENKLTKKYIMELTNNKSLGNLDQEINSIDKRLIESINNYNLTLAGVVNNDETLLHLELNGNNIFNLDDKAVSLNQVKIILKRLNLI